MPNASEPDEIAGAPARAPGVGRWARPVVGLVATGVFVWLAFGKVDWHEVRRVAIGARVAPLLLALVLLALGLLARLVRWWWMLRTLTPRLTLGACARPYLVSLALNNTLPLRAGDVMRAVAFRDALGVPPMSVLGTMLIERLLDLCVLVAMFFFGLVATPPGAVPRALVVGGAAVGAATVVGLLVLVLAPAPLRTLVERVLALGAVERREWAPRAAAGARQLFDTLALVRSPARAAWLLALSAAAWLLEGAVFASVAYALGTGGGPLAPWFACVTGTLATILPSAPGYVGTYDYFVIRGLSAHGAEGAAAAAFALVVHILIWMPVTLLGLALLAVTRPPAAPAVRSATAAEAM
jgi:uncharacterized protein (TIRG00374 family)